VGQAASTHILKPEHTEPELYYFTVRNEYTIMRLARAAGLQVPEVSIHYVPEAFYLVERFDRIGKAPQIERIHVLDGCQLLALSAGAKYRQSNIETLLQLKQLCRSQGLTALKIFRWLVFNFLVGNGDAHLKNLSFSYRNQDIELLPHYDLLSTTIYAPTGEAQNEMLSQPLGSALYFGQVRKQNLIEVAERFGLRRQIAEKEITELVQKLTQAMEQEYRRLETAPNYSSKAGELRMLREIQYLAIQPHSEQLK